MRGPAHRRGPGLEMRAYALLMLAYPPAFRERNAGEMTRLFRERSADARRARGLLGAAGLWALTVEDFLVNAPPERLRQLWLWWNFRNTPAGLAGRKERGGRVDSLTKDLKYAVRTLVKSPAFALIAIVTIGLGIGANTAIFSVVRAVLLAPLPYEEPEQLVMLWGEMQNRGVENFPTSPPVLRDVREQSRLYEAIGGISSFQTPLGGDGDPFQIDVGGVTPNFFDLLGVEPALGRTFTGEDAAPSSAASGNAFNPAANPPTVTVISDGLWRQNFGGDPSVLGRTIDLGGSFVEIIGVLPPDFEPLFPAATNVPTRVDAWITPRIDYDGWDAANVIWSLVGRLRPGVTLEQARAEADAIAARVREKYAIYNTAGFAFEVVPVHEDLTEQVRPIVLALLGAVGFVLLIACANVSNLLLVRAASREREIAIRSAMGGSRLRLVRQMLIESLVLAGLGGALGLVLAQAGVQGLIQLRPENLPRLDDVGIDGLVLLFTVLATGAAAVFFGLVPALLGTRVGLAGSLKDRGNAASAGSNRWVRNGVVVSEVALSVVLLIGAGLMVRSFVALQRVDPGYTTQNVLTFKASLPFGRYPTPESRNQFELLFQERLEALGGASSVAGVFPLPLDGPAFNGRYGTEEALADEAYFRQGAYKIVLPGYFETVGAELLSGRFFTPADNADSSAVVVVDELLAEATWPGESAIGKRLLVRVSTPGPQWVEVVGVVRHQRHAGLAENSRELLFLTERYSGSFGNLTWVVKTTGDPLALIPAVQAELRSMDPGIPLADVRTFDSFVDDAMAPSRFALILIGLFGLTALILASVGLYGVLASVVRQRVAEIGVRMAFGAEPKSILGLVVGQGLKLAGAGLVVGLLIALAVTDVMESLLVEVSPDDPATFAGIAVLFLIVATVSCWVPARRATRVDPVVALRQE